MNTKLFYIIASIFIIGCGGPSGEYEGLTADTHYKCDEELCDSVKQAIELYQPYIHQYKITYGNYIKKNVNTIYVVVKPKGTSLGKLGILCVNGRRGVFKSSKSSIYFCEDIVNSQYEYGVISHEIGHSLGLNHSLSGIMIAVIKNKKELKNLSFLSEETKQELDYLYYYSSYEDSSIK